MGEILILILSVLYFITFLLYICIEIIDISKHRKIRTISYIRFMFSIVYGFLPAVTHYKMYQANEIVFRIAYDSNGVMQLYILYLLSLIAYIFLNIGYKIRKSKFQPKSSSNLKIKKVLSTNKLFIASIIALIIGFISFLMWTRAFGSPFGAIEYATLLRSGLTPFDNPLSFMKRFSPLMLFSSYIFFAIILNMKAGLSFKKIATYLLLLFSSFWSIIYLLSNDGRMSFIYFFVIFILYFILHKQTNSEKGNIKSTLVKIGIWLLIAFVAMSLADWIMYFLRFGEGRDAEISLNIFNLLRDEMGYTILSGQTALTSLENGLSGNRIFLEFLSMFFAFLPSRFSPTSLQTLFEYNTELTGINNGTVPTDLLAFCLYTLGIFGVIIIPILLGDRKSVV